MCSLNKISIMKLAIIFAALLSTITCCDAQESAETVIVEVTGIGKDAESAEKSALYSAVQQAVGSYLDQETVIKNEEIIHEKLLTVSQGFVEKYDVLIPAKERRDGSTLWEIKIKAVVKKSAVGAALRTAGVMQTAADGSDAWAKQATTLKSREEAMDLLKKVIPEIPRNLVMGRIVQSDGNIETHEDTKTGNLKAIIKIEYSINTEWWLKEAYPALDAALTALNLRDKPPLEQELVSSKVIFDGDSRQIFKKIHPSISTDIAQDGLWINVPDAPSLVQAINYSHNAFTIYSPKQTNGLIWGSKVYKLPATYFDQVMDLLNSNTYKSNKSPTPLFTVKFVDVTDTNTYSQRIDNENMYELDNCIQYFYKDALGYLSLYDPFFGGLVSDRGVTFLSRNDPDERSYKKAILIPSLNLISGNSSGRSFAILPKGFVASYLMDVPQDVLRTTKKLKLETGFLGVTTEPLHRGDDLPAPTKAELVPEAPLKTNVIKSIPPTLPKSAPQKTNVIGSAKPGYLGIDGNDLTPKQANELGLKSGIQLSSILKKSPAQVAGLKVGDVILSVDGNSLDITQVGKLTRSLPPATEIHLDILRQGQRMHIPVTLGIRP
jgi:hypothetical protein